MILPWGKYCYNVLPMGLKISADVFQRELGNLFADCEFVLVYIDDLLVLTKGTFKDHLEKVEIALTKLRDAGMQVHPEKSMFGRGEVEYLGYHLTREGIKPHPKKITAILNVAKPTTLKEFRRFVGLVNFYRDVWKGKSQHMAPLADLIDRKKGQVQWTEEATKAFENVKKMCAELQQDV